MSAFRGILALHGVAGLLMLSSSAAMAMPESCQKEFTPLMEKRQAYMNQIEGFKKKKPSAPQACNSFGGLSASNKKLVEWMASQKDWCQIPDEMLDGMKGQQAQIDKVRGQACGVAAKQAQMMKNAARQQRQQQAGPGIGSGVRLPQGAL